MIKFLQTPTKLKKIVLGGLLLLICVAMVITLIPGGFLGDSLGGGMGQNVVAKVGDQELTSVEVSDYAKQMEKRLGGRGMQPQLRPLLFQQAVNDLIVQKALLSEASRMGLKVSDQELRDEIEHGVFGAILFPGGNFVGQTAYENFVQDSFQLRIPQFEELFKAQLVVQKLQSLVQAGAMVSDADVRREYERKNTKVKFDYAVVTMDNIIKQIKPSDAELKAFYEQHKDQYVGPEKRKVQYVLIDAAKLKSQVPISADDYNRYYSQHQDEFRVPEQVEVRHILIRTPAGPDGKPDATAVEGARKKAQDVLAKVKAGGNFADLAKKYSEDPGSGKNGGSLGAIRRGQTVPEFEKAAFSLEKGQTSGLVQSSFGFHIIRVENKQQAHVKPLEEVKPKIETALGGDKLTRLVDSLANTVQSEARATDLQKAAAKHGLEVVDTGSVTRATPLPGIGASPEFMEAMFAAKEKNPPETVRLAQGGAAIFQVTEIQPPTTQTFEEAKIVVENSFKQQRAQAMLGQKIQELADRAHAEHDLKKAAKEVGAEMKATELVSIDGQVPDIGQMSGQASVVFGMKPGEISNAIPVGEGNGGAVIQLLQKQEASMAEFDQSKERIKEGLLQQKRNMSFQLFRSSLLQQMDKNGKIKINKQAMEKVMPHETGS